MNKTLHVVALNIPWPANYGGVIDIYYKVKALHECGVKIILHCFEYERPHAAELEAICEEVHYYRRRTGWQTNISLLPYNVYSRKDERLLRNLRKDDYPILFEGLHTCYYLTDPELAGRIKIFRGCNIEHDYYHAIGQAEHHPLKKLFLPCRSRAIPAIRTEGRGRPNHAGRIDERLYVSAEDLPEESRRIYAVLSRLQRHHLERRIVRHAPLPCEIVGQGE